MRRLFKARDFFYYGTFLVLMMLFCNSAHAGLGTYLQEDQIPYPICKITLEKNGQLFHCSGTLVHKNYVKTAAHCLIKSLAKKVECAFNTKSIVVKSYPHPKFRPNKLKQNLNSRRYDMALLELKDEIKITPARLILDKLEFDKIIRNTSLCAIAGFGLNLHSPKKTGQLNVFKVNQKAFNLNEVNLLIINDRYQSMVLPGDSGGGLFCLDDKGHYVDMGTVSAHGWDFESIIAANFNEASFLASFISFDINQLTQKKQDQFRTRLKQQIFKCLKSLSLALNNSSHGDPCAKIEFPLDQSLNVNQIYRLTPFTIIENKGQKLFLGDQHENSFKVKELHKNYALGTLKINNPSTFFICTDNLACESEYKEVKVKTSNLRIKKIMPKDYHLTWLHQLYN